MQTSNEQYGKRITNAKLKWIQRTLPWQEMRETCSARKQEKTSANKIWSKNNYDQEEEKQVSKTSWGCHRSLNNLGIDKITEIMNNIYNSGEILEDLRRSFLTADKEARSNETIIFMSHRTKLITRIL